MNLMKKAGKIHRLKLKMNKKNKNLYFQTAGIVKEKAEKIIIISTAHAIVPEPIRIAHLIASGIVLGESRGRA